MPNLVICEGMRTASLSLDCSPPRGSSGDANPSWDQIWYWPTFTEKLTRDISPIHDTSCIVMPVMSRRTSFAPKQGTKGPLQWCEQVRAKVMRVLMRSFISSSKERLFSSFSHLTLLWPSNVPTSFTLGVTLTPAIKTSRKLLELILFPKFKCEVLYVCWVAK